MLRFSVIIPNYNYGRFVGEAISSALDADWPDVEVIVVDDGSTDDSRDTIGAFGDRITAIYQQNAGQSAACSAGFAVSSGEAVIFLDSDDLLHPSALRRIAAAWTPSVSKVQVQMSRLDADATALGSVFPRFRKAPSPDDIRRWFLFTSAYPTPPGSGNAFSRWFLEQLLPCDPPVDSFIDSLLLAAAPLYGDVLTLVEPLVGYRIHSANDSDLLVDGTRFDREVARAVRRFRSAYAQRFPQRRVPMGPLRRSRELLQLRVAARALTPHTRSLPGDSLARLILDVLLSPFGPGYEGIVHRALVLGWCIVVLTSPGPVRSAAIRYRYARA